MNHAISFEKLEPQIRETMLRYISIGSFTGTASERDVEPFLQATFEAMPYFQAHPENWGFFPVPDDALNRKVVWGMVEGAHRDTVCLVHHYDVVGVEDFKSFKDLALDPPALMEALRQNIALLTPEAAADLETGDFLFGKGGCDMKAGGAIELCLLRAYGDLALEGALEGSVLLLCVPDEENLSAGMRGAALLLEALQQSRDLRYQLMINTEPHMRKDPAVGVFSLGSIGKVMPFVYVRGSLSHAGKVFEGVNPVALLSDVIRRTELSMDFTDTLPTGPGTSECSLPPTWLYAKDSKTMYDVSMPLTAYGCVNVLTLTSTPAEVLARLEAVCKEAAAAYLETFSRAFAAYSEKSQRPAPAPVWNIRVARFGSLVAEAKARGGDVFSRAYDDTLASLERDVREGKTTLLAANEALVSFVMDNVEETGPRIVCGLLPPYYPCVSNLQAEKNNARIAGLYPTLRAYAKKMFAQEYDREYFFTGLSDLSYVMLADAASERFLLTENMPLFGHGYDLPLEAIQRISMPCINIGPWGKDFHKLSERVLLEDVLRRTPRLVDAAVCHLWEGLS